MAKLTLTDLASLTNETSAITTINNNNDAIEQAMEKTLTRDGTSPNSLSAQLDMNTHKIINLDKGTATGEALEYSQLQEKVDDIELIYNQAVTAKNQAQSAQAAAELAESGAKAAEDEAEDILAAIQIIYDQYNNQFLGTFAGDPTVDNDGNPLTTGDIWYNSITLSMRVWDGAQAQDVAAMTPTSTNTITNKIYQSAVFRNTFVPETNDGAAIGTTSLKFSDLFLASGAVINFNSGDVTLTHSANNLAFAGASTGYTFDAKTYPTSNDGAPLGDTTHNWSDLFLASGAVINFNNGDVTLTHSSGVLTANGSLIAPIFQIDNGFKAFLSGSDPEIAFDSTDALVYSRSGNFYNWIIGNTSYLAIATGALLPGLNDNCALGAGSQAFSDLFLASGAVVNFANGNYTLTHSSGLLNFSGSGQFGNTLFVSGGYSGAYSGGSTALKLGGGGSSPNAAAIGWGDGSGWILNLGYNSSSVFTPRYQFVDSGAFRPATSDAAVLGDTTHMWSDLFLASGGVVNFNNGDFTLTHSAGILTANKDIQITTAGTNSTSVVTVGGTQTLTNKTLTNPIVGTQSQGDNSTKAASTAYVDRTTREVLTANRTYYVRTDGSDSNNGLANTSGGAFLTIQKAIDTACALDLSIYNVTINVADGTYAGGVVLKPYLGTGPIAIIGNTTTPANCLLQGTGARISAGSTFATYQMRGFETQTITSGNSVALSGAGILELNNWRFGPCAGSHMRIDNGARLSGKSGSFEVAANATYFAIGGYLANIDLNSATINFAANVTFTATAYAQYMAVVNFQQATFNLGAFTVTGQRYNASGNSLISSGGAGASFIPGSTAGAVASGGTYL